VLRAEQAGMPEGAALVESTFQDFDSAIQKVVEVEPQSGA
jgi:hypothetical protein